jgi:hypothetical protein
MSTEHLRNLLSAWAARFKRGRDLTDFCRPLQREMLGHTSFEFNVSTRVDRHLVAVRLMSYMAFSDDSGLRNAAETTSRAKLAEWYATTFAHRAESKQREGLLRIRKMQDELPRALADPAKWAKNWIFNNFLEPIGGLAGGVAVTVDAARWLDDGRDQPLAIYYGSVQRSAGVSTFSTYDRADARMSPRYNHPNS